MRIAQTVSGRRRWCSTTRPATPCVRSAGWCWSRTRSTRPPSGGLSQTNRAITTRFVSVGRPTRSWPTEGSPPSQPSPTAPPESSSPPPSADGRIAVPTPIAASFQRSKRLPLCPIGIIENNQNRFFLVLECVGFLYIGGVFGIRFQFRVCLDSEKVQSYFIRYWNLDRFDIFA